MVSEELGLVAEGSRKMVARGWVGFQTIVGQDLASEALASQSLQRIQLEGRVLLVAWIYFAFFTGKNETEYHKIDKK